MYLHQTEISQAFYVNKTKTKQTITPDTKMIPLMSSKLRSDVHIMVILLHQLRASDLSWATVCFNVLLFQVVISKEV